MADVYEVAAFLKEKGYVISDCIGVRHDKPHCAKVVGILKETKPKKRASHIGNLWLKIDSPVGKAKTDGNWFLEVYGKENTCELSKIKNELSGKYGVEIEMREDTQKREELCPNEYGCG